MASVASQGHSTPICTVFGRATSAGPEVAHARFTSPRSGLRPQVQARGRGEMTSPEGAASGSFPLTVPPGAPDRPGSGSSSLSAHHFRAMIAPNNSFKPKPLRGSA
jgi:hypothetical protein